MVEEAKPPIPLVSSHSRRDARSRLRQMVSSIRRMISSQLRHFAVDLDGPVGRGQFFKKSLVVLETFNRMCEQPAQPACVLSFGLRYIADARFEVLAARIHGANHHFVSENELQIDLVRRDLYSP